MRAAVHTAANEPMRIEELADPHPRAGEIAIDVTSCGACHTDLHVLKGELPFPVPAVLGHEVAGVVSEIGPEVTGFSVGDRVVTSFIMPCGQCGQCARGNEEICEKFFAYNRGKGQLYDGETRLFRPGGEPVWMYSMGGLAERSVTPATAAYRVPDGVELADVASVGCSTMTAYGALRHAADVRVGDTVAVVAAGGVGSALIQLAGSFGASVVVAVDISEDKLANARALGATHTVNSAEVDAPAAIREITGGRGVDVAFEALGSVPTFEAARDSVVEGGQIVVVGIAPRGTSGEFDLATIARRKLQIKGSYGAKPRRDMPVLLDLVARGLLRPQDAISRRYSFDQVQDAYDALRRGETVGRAVVDIG
ncbi:Zn-dependent alcohol dehydrogenase [Saccharopolyspora erythraea NRRL 2338]|uniref:Alcohol dehydrogenase, zinc-binding domain protein n=2 Tax=Saccharopolyspora erythraea TaxID=1836 RepID=A4F9I8_SACEN|nr:zinc-binding dehydrogenase [Saccharopolyspora erythraea]EQD87347.1 alcohol dehydrogenase [Saccharopolyspora erythraea D]PFG94500.1 Zn-dependent alcohol dehydrogenase [Saccharopolyspora erythraea NRRL 2338]QRK91253.1 zinc-binding dehydrogenase [Saccharopolyspora erythraea]CAM00713.1 alcohol dehydrogenase, zinc-binding domain protein [Saccharopolyspora erythraea NRRL 2338]